MGSWLTSLVYLAQLHVGDIDMRILWELDAITSQFGIVVSSQLWELLKKILLFASTASSSVLLLANLHLRAHSENHTRKDQHCANDLGRLDRLT